MRTASEYKLGLWVREQHLVGYAVRTPLIIEQLNDALAARSCPCLPTLYHRRSLSQAGVGRDAGENTHARYHVSGMALCGGGGVLMPSIAPDAG